VQSLARSGTWTQNRRANVYPNDENGALSAARGVQDQVPSLLYVLRTVGDDCIEQDELQETLVGCLEAYRLLPINSRCVAVSSTATLVVATLSGTVSPSLDLGVTTVSEVDNTDAQCASIRPVPDPDLIPGRLPDCYSMRQTQ
jgi:hypothetical protein